MEGSPLSRSTTLNVDALRREQFPVTHRWAWFNHATFGPPPTAYLTAVREFTERMAAADLPEGYGLWGGMVDDVRAAAARFVNCEVDDVAFLKNTAEGLGVVALGLDWKPGDEVIAYNQAFPADVYPWMNLGSRGVTLKLIEDRGRQRHEVADVEALMTPRTRLVCLELVNFNSGFRAPVEEVAKLCHDHGAWLLVDATQAAGALRIDVRELGCDVLIAHGYKFLMSGWGTAISYFAPHTRERLGVPEPGWKSLRDLKNRASLVDYQMDWATEARRWEPGIPDIVGIMGLGAVVKLMSELGTREIEERVLAYADEVSGALEEQGWSVVSSRRAGERSGILSLKRDGVDMPKLAEELRSRDVSCAVREGRLRVSVHFYNDRSDLDRLLDCLPR
jgi:cysteine desulfurase / selenocysteine lyase